MSEPSDQVAPVDAERANKSAKAGARQAINFARKRLQATSWTVSLAHLGLTLACPVEQDLTTARANADSSDIVEEPPRPSSSRCGASQPPFPTRDRRGALHLADHRQDSHRELYRKFGATSRADAIARAEALGLRGISESPG